VERIPQAIKERIQHEYDKDQKERNQKKPFIIFVVTEDAPKGSFTNFGIIPRPLRD
jgi:hypothetical protein